jgi:hypothetical protein
LQKTKSNKLGFFYIRFQAVVAVVVVVVVVVVKMIKKL